MKENIDTKSCCSSLHEVKPNINNNKLNSNTKNGLFYCPMLCEGEKVYQFAGSCSVCGMDLVLKPGTETTTNILHLELYKKLIFSIIFCVPVFIISMFVMVPNNPLIKILNLNGWNWVQFILTLPIVFYSCNMFFVKAYKSIISLKLNMFTLIGLGTGVAFTFSIFGLIFPNLFPAEFKNEQQSVNLYFESTCVILTLALIGQYLEAKAHNQTNSALKDLIKLSPSEATIIINKEYRVISINSIIKGHILLVKPGEKIPVDGSITKGNTEIDESSITGEPIPVFKKEGDVVIGGTINGNKSFEMIAQKVGSETLLSQIIKMVSDASSSKAPIQKIIDKISNYFVPIVIFISFLTFIIWKSFGPEPSTVYGFINAITVLIIACPCALGLATPISVMVGIGKAANLGILIKNAEVIEKINKINYILTDKTGTITEGKPSIEKIVLLSDNNQKDIYNMVFTISNNSEHPISKSISNFLKNKGSKQLEINNFETITGMGIIGEVAKKNVALGNLKLLEKYNISLEYSLKLKIENDTKEGKTFSFIILDNEILGYIIITDKIKNSSKEAIKSLKNEGIEIMMLTGDNENTASRIAKEINIEQYKSNCLPEDKLKEIKRLQGKGKKVIMAGDGINDAPALTQADVGIAMGSGSGISINSAEIILINGDLKDILKTIKLSKYILKNIRQNIFFAFIYNAIGVTIATGIFYPFFNILLTPMMAAIAMSLSSVSVITNSLKIKKINI